ncbi:C-factor [Rhodoplanes sp. SY1]|uniref:C-factor n=1 Tax=Rhodoplanes sp. SY1 TaxID=3166646 RepID=UPI0038B65D96
MNWSCPRRRYPYLSRFFVQQRRRRTLFNKSIETSIVVKLAASGAFEQMIGFSRKSAPEIQLVSNANSEPAVAISSQRGELRLVIDATGFLHDEQRGPEKTCRDLSASEQTRLLAPSATGPDLVLEHVLPRLPRTGELVVSTLTARVGSICDNQLGWYGYRALEAASNRVRTAAIELRPRRPDTICVALHPGTVATCPSSPFVKYGPEGQRAAHGRRNIRFQSSTDAASAHGCYFEFRGERVPWCARTQNVLPSRRRSGRASFRCL